MGTKYSTVSISSYNASPPADDGSSSASNQITWSKHKEKLGDPLKTAVEAINTNLVTALNKSAIAKTDTYTVTAAEHDKTIEVTTDSAGCDIILLSAATAAAGFITTVLNAAASTSDLTVKVNTGDLLNGDTDGVIVLPVDSSLTFIVNSGTNGWNIKNAHAAHVKGTKSYDIKGPSDVSSGVLTTLNIRNMPAGIVQSYAGTSVPTGWLDCDGSAVSRTTYADLFAAISTTWGIGNGTTTFNLPNLKGRAIIGSGTGSTTEDVTAGAVSISAGASSAGAFTVVSNVDKWVTGMAVTLSTDGSLPNGVSTGVTYYTIRESSTQLMLASSLANAQNGTPLELGTQGAGTHTITYAHSARTVGGYGGEEAHAMSLTEMLSHRHPYEYSTNGAGSNVNVMATGNSGSGSFYPTLESGSMIKNRGGNAGMNNMSPYAVLKYIISY